jgi:hypothetical protein
MRATRGKSLLERNADADLWHHTLSQIPTVFGRLIYLAGLRDPLSGEYEHHGLSLLFGAEGADNAIKSSHRKTFQDWLLLPLSAKLEDLLDYVHESGKSSFDVQRTWTQTEVWRGFAPAGAGHAEKALYGSDMRNLLKLLAARHAVSGPDPVG